jgi:hypothetical protein
MLVTGKDTLIFWLSEMTVNPLQRKKEPLLSVCAPTLCCVVLCYQTLLSALVVWEVGCL